MNVDPNLIRQCKQARAQLQAAEEGLAQARSEFERVVRRLYVEGASTREIAVALELSHQRVHQLIGAAPRSWWQRLVGVRQEPARGCSFCGRSAKQVAKLVAGPSVHICGDCVDTAACLLEGGNGEHDKPFESLPATSPKRCSFCGKRGRGLARVTARGQQICGSCTDMARDIAGSRGG
jgi:hypothetical protein